MAPARLNAVIQHIRGVAAANRLDDLSDRDLLREYVTWRSGLAFAAIVSEGFQRSRLQMSNAMSV